MTQQKQNSWPCPLLLARINNVNTYKINAQTPQPINPTP